MALPQGIAFRETAGYVTDGANDYGETYVDGFGGGNYPTVSTQGNNVGWEDGLWSLNSRDRSTTVDVRLAGTHFTTNIFAADYRIDLPATGSHNLRLAGGDASSGNHSNIDMLDGSTLLGTADNGYISGGTFNDAVDTNYSSANWPGSNSVLNATFATTICRFRVNPDSSADANTIAYVYVESAGGGGDVLMAQICM